jgi:hypothetical protein
MRVQQAAAAASACVRYNQLKIAARPAFQGLGLDGRRVAEMDDNTEYYEGVITSNTDAENQTLSIVTEAKGVLISAIFGISPACAAQPHDEVRVFPSSQHVPVGTLLPTSNAYKCGHKHALHCNGDNTLLHHS